MFFVLGLVARIYFLISLPDLLLQIYCSDCPVGFDGDYMMGVACETRNAHSFGTPRFISCVVLDVPVYLFCSDFAFRLIDFGFLL